MKISFLIAATTLAADAFAATAAQWRPRSIYQVLTDRFARTDGSTTATCNAGEGLYCGGTYQGLINKLDYIQDMGFTAVGPLLLKWEIRVQLLAMADYVLQIWISPVTLNLPQNTIDGEAYHGYWQQDIYKLNSNFGTLYDLRNLSQAVHNRNMRLTKAQYLMVDIVTNHYGFAGNGTSVDYQQFTPFNSQSYFHTFCLIDYNNQTSIENCWEGDNIVSLPDLRTEDPVVASMWGNWITGLVANYSIDGLRIDSAREVNQDFFPTFATAAGVFCTGEVDDGDPAITCPYQNYLDSVLNYPMFYPLTDAFSSNSGSMSDLVNQINDVKSSCKDSTLLGSFSENHDNQRFANRTSDLSLAKNVIAFTILADGVPIIYEGQEQHYSGGQVPYNREAVWLSSYDTTAPLYAHIAQLNQIRNQSIYKNSTYLMYQNYPIYSDTTTIAMRKGFDDNQIVAVLSNKGAEGSSYTLMLGNTGFTVGDNVMEVLGCTQVTVDGSGNIAVAMGQGLPKKKNSTLLVFLRLADNVRFLSAENELYRSNTQACALPPLDLLQASPGLGKDGHVERKDHIHPPRYFQGQNHPPTHFSRNMNLRTLGALETSVV
ncbi:MAG: hypothetical protein M1827_006965 [Pycnora praestabilis]|nr:MAG: hypothetical protein M1827_006965 [Pycnora praestabilis]